MKQLLIIIAIFLAVTAATSIYFEVSRDAAPPSDVILSVNDHGFTMAQIDAYFSGQFPDSPDGHHGDPDAKLQAFAEERVLIQEAQRLAIDQKQDFRDKIQRYYEYSLISALRNRQEQKFHDEVAADTATLDIITDRFIDLYGRTVTFRMSGDDQQTTMPFSMVPNLYKPVLADMSPGQTRQIVQTGNTPTGVTLIDIGDTQNQAAAPPDRQAIRQQLIDYLTGVRLSQWLDQLNKDAMITYGKEQ